METSNSDRFSLDWESLLRLARNALIIFVPAILLSLEQIQNGQYDTPAIKAAFVACAIDTIRRYLTDYSIQK